MPVLVRRRTDARRFDYNVVNDTWNERKENKQLDMIKKQNIC